MATACYRLDLDQPFLNFLNVGSSLIVSVIQCDHIRFLALRISDARSFSRFGKNTPVEAVFTLTWVKTRCYS
jgi:hypothetical protein